MCRLKSAIILKDRIFMPDYDSHSDMLEELGIKDDYLGASKVFVRAELSPKDGDVFSDVEGWEPTLPKHSTTSSACLSPPTPMRRLSIA